MVQLEQVKAQLEEAKEKVWPTVKKIVSILEQDIQAHVMNAVKEVFMQNFEYVQTMTKEKVSQLKKEAKVIAEEAKNDITKRLLTTDKWFVDQPVAGYKDSIFQNGEISIIIKSVDRYIHALLAKYRFPGEEEPGKVPYDVTPYDLSYFKSEEILKSLSRDYWKEVSEYYQVKQKYEQLEADLKREAARKIWDEAI